MLAKAVSFCPKAEVHYDYDVLLQKPTYLFICLIIFGSCALGYQVLWLMRAKEKWLAGNVDEARVVLNAVNFFLNRQLFYVAFLFLLKWFYVFNFLLL